MPKNEVAIIIPTFNSYIFLKEHFSYLEKQTFKYFDAIIIDSGNSQDHELLKHEKRKFNIIVKYFKEDLGGAGSLYEGMQIAYKEGYKYIILSDSDAYPISENLVEELVKNSDEKTVTYGTNILKKYKEKEGENMEKVKWAPFHYFAVPREIIREIGYPRRDFFIYNDDVEYCDRINKRFTILQLNNVFYKHLSSTLTTYFTKGMSARASYYTVRNRIMTTKSIPKKVSVIANSTMRTLLAAYSLDPGSFLMYWSFLAKGSVDGLRGKGGSRSIPKIELNLEFEKHVADYPKEAYYLTNPAKDNAIKSHQKANDWKTIDISKGVSDAFVMRLMLSNKPIIVNDYVVNQQITTRLAPFLFLGRLYILTDTDLLKVSKKKPY